MRKGEAANSIQSTAGHVKPRGKPEGPPPKPKYYLVTDSVVVEVEGGDCVASVYGLSKHLACVDKTKFLQTEKSAFMWRTMYTVI